MRLCSKCNFKTNDVMNFCPECGAEMLKPENGKEITKQVTKEKKYPTVMVILGLVNIGCSFVPMLTNVSILLGLGSTLSSIVLMCTGKYRIPALILAIVASLLGVIIAFVYQYQLAESISRIHIYY